MHTDRDDLERLAERLAERATPSDVSEAEFGFTHTPVDDFAPAAPVARAEEPSRPPEQLPALRDRSRLPRVYLEARRRLRERLESASEN